jgi:hypothetical protein
MAYDNSVSRGGGGLKRTLIIVVLAFLGGLGVMGWAISKWSPARELVLGEASSPRISSVPSGPTGAQPNLVVPPEILQAEPMRDRIAALESRIDRLQSLGGSGSGNSARAEGLLIAFAARRAIDRGLALGYLEGALQQYYGQNQPRAVGIVIASAHRPVTIDALKDGLIAIGPKLVSGTSEKGWWESFRESLGSLIIVRTAGMPSSTPAERLARAQRMVDAGRIDVALVEVARLPGAAHASVWMRDARRLVEAHRALDLLEAAAIIQPGKTNEPRPLSPISPPAQVPPKLDQPAQKELGVPEAELTL